MLGIWIKGRISKCIEEGRKKIIVVYEEEEKKRRGKVHNHILSRYQISMAWNLNSTVNLSVQLFEYSYICEWVKGFWRDTILVRINRRVLKAIEYSNNWKKTKQIKWLKKLSCGMDITKITRTMTVLWLVWKKVEIDEGRSREIICKEKFYLQYNSFSRG